MFQQLIEVNKSTGKKKYRSFSCVVVEQVSAKRVNRHQKVLKHPIHVNAGQLVNFAKKLKKMLFLHYLVPNSSNKGVASMI